MKIWCLFMLIMIGVSCTRQQPVQTKFVYIPVDESVLQRDSIQRIVKSLHILNRSNDSLQCMIDSLTGELTISKYKLERIRYYNNLNKPKFVKGWINRVLEE